MTVWMRNVAAAAVALTLAVGSVGCDDDDGFGLALQVFFNLAGTGQYSSVTATVDLSQAQAVIDPGTCELSNQLQQAGCTLSVSGTPGGSTTTLGGDTLEITVSGCTINSNTSLGSCLLQSGSPSDIQQAVTVNGTCAPGSACDVTPDVCVSTSGPDDFCGFGPTTTTTSTSSTSSTSMTAPTTSSTSTTSLTPTTTTSTTTTTMGGPVTECEITMGVTNSESLGALSWSTDYSGSGGAFVGSGAAVQCTTLAGDFAAYNNCDQPGGCPPLAFQELTVAVISASGFTTPVDVSRCNWAGSGTPVPGDFAITVTDATRPDFSPATVTVAVTNIQCTTPTTTTTTTGATTTTSVTSTSTSSTSSTSLGPVTTTTTVPQGNPRFTIQLNLEDTSGVSVGALGFVVDYTSAPGDFIGSGADIGSGGTLQCTRSAGDFGSFNDNDTARTLNAAYVSLGGFQGPTQVALCNFEQTGGSAPVAGDFTITVTDASQPNLNPITPLPTVSIGTILPLP